MTIIKRAAIFLGLSLCLLTTQAQEINNKWNFGAKAGLSFYDNYGTVTGFMIGATAEYNLSKNFYLRSGLEFVKTGDCISKDFDVIVSTNPEVINRIRFSEERITNFLQVPLSVGYRLPVSKQVNITLDAGAYFGVGLYSQYTFDDSESIYTESTNELTQWIDESKTGNIDLGLQGSIGVEYQKFSLNFNYQGGLLSQSIEKNDRINEKLKNKAFIVTVGYTF